MFATSLIKYFYCTVSGDGVFIIYSTKVEDKIIMSYNTPILRNNRNAGQRSFTGYKMNDNCDFYPITCKRVSRFIAFHIYTNNFDNDDL